MSASSGEAIAADLILVPPPISTIVAIVCAARWRRQQRRGSRAGLLGWLLALLFAAVCGLLAICLLALENAPIPVPIH